MRIDAFRKRQFVPKAINHNSIVDRHIRSTVKTLPATLPELNSKDLGPRTEATGTHVFNCGFAELIIGFDVGNIFWLAFLCGKLNSVLKSPNVTLATIKNLD